MYDDVIVGRVNPASVYERWLEQGVVVHRDIEHEMNGDEDDNVGGPGEKAGGDRDLRGEN